jgi:hypothetical protein
MPVHVTRFSGDHDVTEQVNRFLAGRSFALDAVRIQFLTTQREGTFGPRGQLGPILYEAYVTHWETRA